MNGRRVVPRARPAITIHASPPIRQRAVLFEDEDHASVRAVRFSALALRVGDPIDICVDGTFGRWRRTVVTAVRRDGVRVAGLRAPATTGVACPWCGEPVVMTDTPTPDLQLFYCPGCGHRWWLDHDLTNA